MWNRLTATFVAMLFCGCAADAALRDHHFRTRGVWVATVGNIDWPSRRDLSAAEQKAELIRIFDRAASLGLNAVFLQVRPSADAIYPAEQSCLSSSANSAGGLLSRRPIGS